MIERLQPRGDCATKSGPAGVVSTEPALDITRTMKVQAVPAEAAIGESAKNHQHDSAISTWVSEPGGDFVRVSYRAAKAHDELRKALRDNVYLDPEYIAELVAEERSPEAAKRLLMHLYTCRIASLADVEQFFGDGQLAEV